MSSYERRSFLDKLVAACLTLLISAAAVYIAVKLIVAVWAALVVVLGVVAFVALAIFLLRARQRNW